MELELRLILTHVTQKASTSGSRGGCGRPLQRPKNKGTVMPLQHARRLPFQWFLLIKGRISSEARISAFLFRHKIASSASRPHMPSTHSKAKFPEADSNIDKERGFFLNLLALGPTTFSAFSKNSTLVLITPAPRRPLPARHKKGVIAGRPGKDKRRAPCVALKINK